MLKRALGLAVQMRDPVGQRSRSDIWINKHAPVGKQPFWYVVPVSVLIAPCAEGS
jgi:hypothetical protein